METVLHNLMRVLSDEVHLEVVVANTKNANESFMVGPTRVHKVRSLGMFAGTSLCPTMPWVLWKLLRKGGFDVVQLHLPNPTGHFALRWVLPKRTKLVITWHSDIVRQKILMRLYLPFLKSLLARADAIVSATPKNISSSTQLQANRFPEKLHAVPFGIDISAYKESERINLKRRGLQERYGERLVFACGRHIYYKGFEYLIRAMDSLPDTTLLLGGRGPLTPELVALAASAKFPPRIVFLGFIAQEDIPAYYHAAAVVAMPSVDMSEAFGMVQLEAMACRKPVVCCELHNGVTYVNQHGVTGLVVEPREPKALATAIEALLNDPERRRRMGEAGYRRVAEQFSLEAMRSGHLSVFARLTGRMRLLARDDEPLVGEEARRKDMGNPII
jgi:rhamnosyl/mannosyltransferase